jgi:hypothetical protein
MSCLECPTDRQEKGRNIRGHKTQVKAKYQSTRHHRPKQGKIHANDKYQLTRYSRPNECSLSMFDDDFWTPLCSKVVNVCEEDAADKECEFGVTVSSEPSQVTAMSTIISDEAPPQQKYFISSTISKGIIAESSPEELFEPGSNTPLLQQTQTVVKKPGQDRFTPVIANYCLDTFGAATELEFDYSLPEAKAKSDSDCVSGAKISKSQLRMLEKKRQAALALKEQSKRKKEGAKKKVHETEVIVHQGESCIVASSVPTHSLVLLPSSTDDMMMRNLSESQLRKIEQNRQRALRLKSICK